MVNMSLTKRRSRLFLSFLLFVQLFSITVYAAECSKTKLCATGCCSSAGYCGTTKDHCGKGCLSTCDFKTECDKNNPCKGNACCSKFGHCGLGPDFCGKDCVAGCDSKGECDPGDFGTKFANHTKCPLNVCCSKHGYCGTTKDFCGKKTVNRPSCSAKGPMRRVVGYIEGWASTRSCDKFTPSDIPDGVYTHINFAFASIDPKTFQIVPSSSKDPVLYRELTRKKKIDPKLKVFIAIGGWDFNDPGPTVTTFSDIARSDVNMRTFIKSLISFMATYDFDGVDIDWEYPAADDRQGREEDFDNLPKFLSHIKSALKQSGERNGLSIAIPASYWYLQHFDLEKISKYVDHFNVMTYDFHGAWDTPKSWLGNHLNSHTNLTEIKDAFDLLWRNKVDPDQVNMGLAFYARTFDVSNTGCMSPGCLFDAGGPKEPCTDAVGVMSNPEIMRKLDGEIGSGELDKTAAVKTLKFGRTWLTYDDVDTWKLKLDFARSQCLGGAMVWAISQDTSDGMFSKQLQEATGYKSKGVTTFNSTKSFGGVFIETEESEANTDISDSQCHWSNCGRECTPGWVGVRNQASDKKSDLLTDDTGCGNSGKRTFCCPSNAKQPYCEWQFYFLNGDCLPGCGPTSGFEVGSSAGSCNNHMAQTACCKGDTSALDVYRQYKWYEFEPTCAIDGGDKLCGWDPHYDSLLTSSWGGSGDQHCVDNKRKRGPRPLCENSRDATKPHFSNCVWSDDYQIGRTDAVTTGTCNANCPKHQIKVALQSDHNDCGKGTSAYCCDVTQGFDHLDIQDDDDLEDLLKEWVKNATCPSLTVFDDKWLSSRSLDNIASDVLLKRQGLSHRMPPDMVANLIAKRFIEFVYDSRETEAWRVIWDRVVTPIWPHLTAEFISKTWHAFKEIIPPLTAAHEIVCDMDGAEEKAKDKSLSEETAGGSGLLWCNIPSLDTYDPRSLEDPREQPDGTDELVDAIEGISDALKFTWPFREWLQGSQFVQQDTLEEDGLEKRGTGSPRSFKPMCPDKSTWSMKSESYTNGDKGEALAKKNGDDKMYYVEHSKPGSCMDAEIKDDGKPNDKKKWVSEHILELQTISMFMEWSMGVQNKLKNKPSRGLKLDIKVPVKSNKLADLSCSMWKDAFTNGFPEWNKVNKETPRKVLFTILGSPSNAKHMVNAESKLNGLKAKIWDFNEPIADVTWKMKYAGMGKKTAQHAFEQLELVEQIFGYLNAPGVKKKLVATYDDVKDFMDEFEELYRKQYPKTPVLGLPGLWTTFMRDLMNKMKAWNRAWLLERATKMQEAWMDEVKKRQKSVNAAKTVASRARAEAYRDEAKDIADMAGQHIKLHALAIDKFRPSVVFK